MTTMLLQAWKSGNMSKEKSKRGVESVYLQGRWKSRWKNRIKNLKAHEFKGRKRQRGPV